MSRNLQIKKPHDQKSWATRTRILGLSVALAALAGCATPPAAQSARNQDAYKALTLEKVQQCIRITDDPLNVSVKFDTRECYQTRHGLLGLVWSDAFLRAWKDRDTGSTNYQIYSILYGKDWLHPQSANFGVNELQSVRGNRIGSDVDCSMSQVMGNCRHKEEFVFDLPEDELRAVAAKLEVDQGYSSWTVRIKTQSGRDVDFRMNPNELVGLLNLVEAYGDH